MRATWSRLRLTRKSQGRSTFGKNPGRPRTDRLRSGVAMITYPDRRALQAPQCPQASRCGRSALPAGDQLLTESGQLVRRDRGMRQRGSRRHPSVSNENGPAAAAAGVSIPCAAGRPIKHMGLTGREWPPAWIKASASASDKQFFEDGRQVICHGMVTKSAATARSVNSLAS